MSDQETDPSTTTGGFAETQPGMSTVDDLLTPPVDVEDRYGWATEELPLTEDATAALLEQTPSNVAPDDLAQALAAPPPSARSLRLTKVLGVGLLVAMGFAGGILAQQHWGQAGAASAQGPGAGLGRSGFPSGDAEGGFPGGQGMGTGTGTGADTGTAGAGGAPGQGGASGATTTGTVTLVDGSVLYVTGADGTVTRVHISDDTTISKPAKAKDLDKGDTVTVSGSTTSDGVTATSVAVTK